VSAASTLTWDIPLVNGGARRPSLEDVGGARLEDEAPPNAPTKTGEMPYADMVNQLQLQVAALAKMAAALTVSIKFTAGAPSVDSFVAPSTLLVLTDIGVVDVSPGVTRLDFAAGKLPPHTVLPKVTINQDGDFTGIGIQGVNSVTIKTRNSASGAADADFTVEISGG